MVVPARVFDLKNDTLTVHRIMDFERLYYAKAAFIQWLVSFVESSPYEKNFCVRSVCVSAKFLCPDYGCGFKPQKDSSRTS
jgi:hypothetical protein